MTCIRCHVHKAVTKLAMGKLVYSLCGECDAKTRHPAYQLAEMFRTQKHVGRLWEKA